MFSQAYDVSKPSTIHPKVDDLTRLNLVGADDKDAKRVWDMEPPIVKVNTSPVFETHGLIVPYLYKKCP